MHEQIIHWPPSFWTIRDNSLITIVGVGKLDVWMRQIFWFPSAQIIGFHLPNTPSKLPNPQAIINELTLISNSWYYLLVSLFRFWIWIIYLWQSCFSRWLFWKISSTSFWSNVCWIRNRKYMFPMDNLLSNWLLQLEGSFAGDFCHYPSHMRSSYVHI